MTLIAGVRAWNGIVLAADTEEIIPEALRTRSEKLHILSNGAWPWKVVLAGAGHADYIGMARDFIEEKVAATPATDVDIVKSIRDSIHEIWRDYARYEPGAVDLKLIIASWSSDRTLRLTITAGAAVRQGRSVEAWGIGDATFRALADRFLMTMTGSNSVGGELPALVIFTIYAMQQAKQTIPGVGGNTRIVSLTNDGTLKWEKSWKIGRVQDFFSEVDQVIKAAVHFDNTGEKISGPQEFLKFLYRRCSGKVTRLMKELKKIEEDAGLL